MVSKCLICEKNTMENNIKKCKKQHICAQINRELASLISISKQKKTNLTRERLLAKNHPYTSNNK